MFINIKKEIKLSKFFTFCKSARKVFYKKKKTIKMRFTINKNYVKM